ncbi:methylmalonyl-CoA mutase [Streptococcus anginosus]|nr:methylmalonyl-CoA mutase [Streptococcus anginosus]
MTSAEVLADAARHRPDLHAFLAINPALLPELRAWLARGADPGVRAELGSHPVPPVVALVCAREMGLFDGGGEEWEEPFDMGLLEVEPLDMSLLGLPAAPAKPKGKRNVLITGNLIAVS